MRSRWVADGPLIFLCLFSLAITGALALFVARASLPFAPFTTCQTFVATLVARLGGLGLLLPLWLLSVVVVAVLVATGHQLWVTRRVLGRVLAMGLPEDARLARIAVAAGLGGRIDLVDGRVPFTFCYGLLRPRVCVSAPLVRLLDDDELVAVLRHEAHHLRHLDPLKILISRALASGLFFLPLAGALRDGFLAGKELCADLDATAAGSELPLASALLKLLRSDRPNWPAGVVAVGAFSPTDARLQQLIRPDRKVRPILPSLWQWTLSAVMIVGFFGFSLGTVVAGYDPEVQSVCERAPVAAAMDDTTPVQAAPGLATLERLANSTVQTADTSPLLLADTGPHLLHDTSPLLLHAPQAELLQKPVDLAGSAGAATSGSTRRSAGAATSGSTRSGSTLGAPGTGPTHWGALDTMRCTVGLDCPLVQPCDPIKCP